MQSHDVQVPLRALHTSLSWVYHHTGHRSKTGGGEVCVETTGLSFGKTLRGCHLLSHCGNQTAWCPMRRHRVPAKNH